MLKKVLACFFSVLTFSLILFSSNATALTMGSLEPEYTGDKIEINTPEDEYSFDVTFLDKNQNLTYKTTLTNDETVPIVITKIDLKNSERNFIEYSYNGVAVNDELQPDETKELTLSIGTNDQNTVTSTEDFKLSIHYHKIATEEPTPEPEILVPGTSTEIPDTGANTNLEISSAKKDQTLFNILIIGGIAIVLLVFLLSNKKIKNTYAIALVLSFCATSFTLSNFATAEKDNVYEITGKVRFTNVYTISIDPGAGKYNGVEGITTNRTSRWRRHYPPRSNL